MLAKWHEPSPGLGYIDLGVGEAQTSFTCTNGISRFAIFRHQAGNIGTMTASLKLGASTASTERSTQYFPDACLPVDFDSFRHSDALALPRIVGGSCLT